MKKILTLAAVVAASLCLASQARAQFGIIGGLTTSKTTVKDAADDFKNISLYHAGLTYKIDLGVGFALQPSLIYQVKGAKVENIGSAASEDFKLKTGFVELPLSIQWGPDLMAFRPYVFAEPFVGYQITSSDQGNQTVADWAKQAKNKVEYGFGLGGGLEIASHLQISVQWFKNMGQMFDTSKTAADVWNQAKDVKNFQGIKVSLAILF